RSPTPSSLFHYTQSDHPQLPHPPPTRRSSDLWETIRPWHFSRSGLPQASPSIRALRPSTASGVCRRTTRTSPGKLRPISPNRTLDRKSTRLNSSHVEISYAVFCL